MYEDRYVYDDYDLRNRGVSDHRRGADRDHRTGGQTAVAPYYPPPPARRPRPDYPRADYPAPPPYGYPPAGYGYYPAPPAPPTESNNKALEWVPDILRGLAAIMPPPNPPTAEPDVATNIANMLTYFGALAQTAQRKEQLHTLAAIAARHM